MVLKRNWEHGGGNGYRETQTIVNNKHHLTPLPYTCPRINDQTGTLICSLKATFIPQEIDNNDWPTGQKIPQLCPAGHSMTPRGDICRQIIKSMQQSNYVEFIVGQFCVIVRRLDFVYYREKKMLQQALRSDIMSCWWSAQSKHACGWQLPHGCWNCQWLSWELARVWFSHLMLFYNSSWSVRGLFS